LWIKTYGLEIIGEAEHTVAFGLVLGVLSFHCGRSLNLTENYQENKTMRVNDGIRKELVGIDKKLTLVQQSKRWWQRFVFEGTVEKRSGGDWGDGSTRMRAGLSAIGSWCRKMIALPPPWQQRQKLFERVRERKL